jgi:uncharacterized OB-fold protein
VTLAVVRVDGRRPYPPRVSAFTQTFWSGLAEGRFLGTRCDACAKSSFPPKPFCPHCWSDRIEWIELDVRGTVYSSTVMHAVPAYFRHEAPYRVGIVDLDDGIRIATRVLGVEEGFGVGARAEIVVLAYEDGPLFAARIDGSERR